MLRRALPVVIVLAGLAAPAGPAHAGSSIKHVPDCPGQFADYSAKARGGFRDGLLCLINAARKTYGLPALKRSAALEKAAQGHADSEAKHGYANHTGRDGSSIASRIAKRGYRAAAYNEALSIQGVLEGPYDFALDLLDGGGHPCSAVLDPRFRDIGIGIERSGGGPVQVRPSYLVIDFGLKRGSKPGSTKTSGAKGCPHKLPKRPFTSFPLVPTGPPVTETGMVTITFKCDATVACAGKATASLPTGGASSPAVDISVSSKATKQVRFAIDDAAIKKELAASRPSIKLEVALTAPIVLKDSVTGPLPAPSR